MRITRLLLVGTLCLCGCATAQIRVCLPEPHTIPEDLRSTLDSRLAAFLSAQAQGKWDTVEELLGRKDVVYKSSYKQCLVSRMQELRMVSFDLFSPDLYACTTTMSLSEEAVNWVTAEQLSWYVRGTGTFQTSSKIWSEETQFKAYRDQGTWYFIPPQRGMQDKWEQAHYTEADFIRDRRDEIDVRNPALTPIEITDVHAHMSRQFPSLRKIKFRLRNKTSKNVVAVSVRIGGESVEGFTEMEGPYKIGPKSNITLEEDVTAYGDFCDGVWKQKIVVREVSFADGSRWQLKEAVD
jgi:hypothetical protein